MKSNPSGLRSYTIIYLIFLYAPILLLPIFAFNDSKVVAFPLTGFTLDWFREMLSEPDLWDLTMACLRAAAKVGQSRKADVADAVGNSSRPSAPTSGADAS